MTKLKKAAAILAVMFVAGIGAGFAAFYFIADMVQETSYAGN